MYFVYDKDGKAHKVGHAIDVRAAINSGNYTKLPPGVKEPEAPKIESEGEKVEGIAPVDEPVNDKSSEQPSAAEEQKSIKSKGVKIPRK